MRSLWLASVALLSGCVFQDLAEVPLNPGNSSTNNTSTNNTSTNNTSTNNTSTNNTSTNNTSTNNNTNLVCQMLPPVCDSYFACNSGTDEAAMCTYSCGCEGALQVCLGQTQICTNRGRPSEQLAFAPNHVALTSRSVVVANNQRFSILGPLLQLQLNVDLPGEVSTLAANHSTTIALGGNGSVHFYSGMGAFLNTIVTGAASFGESLDLAYDDETLAGVVGAPGDKEAIVVEAGPTSWEVSVQLYEILGSERTSFGEQVAISPDGKTILVLSNLGVEVFGLDGEWTYQGVIPLAATTDVDIQATNAWIAVRVGGDVSFYARNTDDFTVNLSMAQPISILNANSLSKALIRRDGIIEPVFFVGTESVGSVERLHLLEHINGVWTNTHIVTSGELGPLKLVGAGLAGNNDPSVAYIDGRSIGLVRLSGAR
jgi:hypothetical protein